MLDGKLVVEIRGGDPAALLKELGTAIKNSASDVTRERRKLGFQK
jgi:hypothetical protein